MTLTTAPTTLGELSARTGLDVLAHLEREMTIPVIDGLQAQGDLIVVPYDLLADVGTPANARWQQVPPAGIELLRSAAGGNPHTLTADPGTCRWTTEMYDNQRLALGMLETSAVAYLIHPEHGATGIAPGRFVIRRQRESTYGYDSLRGTGTRLVAD